MRLAIVNWNRRKIAGTENYLSSLIPELHRLGHSIALWHERDEPPGRERIELPDGSPGWCVAELGRERALTALRQWQPDLLFVNSFVDPGVESATLNIAPAVFFAHAYYGTCVSQAKTFKYPVVRVCTRTFGLGCLLHYYPHRCGGLSPITMWQQYRLQSQRLENLRRYRAIITFSEHMRNEYIGHGFSPARVHCLSSAIDCGGNEAFKSGEKRTLPSASINSDGEDHCVKSPRSETLPKRCWRIAFLGRMEFLKGGHILLDALPHVSATLNCELRVTFAGEGPQRQLWQRKGEYLQSQLKGLSIEFVGWIEKPEVEMLLENCDLLVMPSLWPEPFGLVGLEAGDHGVPTAAFAVGGITDWLIDGVNGYTAPANPATAAGLAEAIIKCLADSVRHDSLRRGAASIAQQFTLQAQARALLEVFDKVTRESRAQGTVSSSEP